MAKKRNSVDTRPIVVVTGIAGRLGRELARKLHRSHRVIGIDRRPAPQLPRDVEHYRLDLRRNRTQGIFRSNKIHAVVHLGTIHNPRRNPVQDHQTNVIALQRLFGYIKKYKIPKLVILSTADVYGPQPENISFLTEESPLLASARFEGVRDLVTIDQSGTSFMWQHPKTETVILRPVHIVGNVRNAAMKFLTRRWVPIPMGYDPMVQMVHQDDVVDALMLALEPGIRGVFNIDGPPALPVSVILRETGRTAVPVPVPFLKMSLRQMWRARATRFPPQEVDHIQWPATVDGSLARTELGYTPKCDLATILEEIREQGPSKGSPTGNPGLAY